MNKRQRKKLADKNMSPGLRTLISSTRSILSDKAIRDYSNRAVNEAWERLGEYLKDNRAMELERIEKGPMRWVGYLCFDQSEPHTEADLIRDSKASGTHAAAGKDKEI